MSTPGFIEKDVINHDKTTFERQNKTGLIDKEVADEDCKQNLGLIEQEVRDQGRPGFIEKRVRESDPRNQ